MENLTEKIKIMEVSQEYKIYKRIEYLDFTWGLCNDNKIELFEIIDNLEKTTNIELFQIYDNIISLLTRRLINHVGTIFLLVDHMRIENEYLENSGFNIGYKDNVEKYFAHNTNTQFVHGLRHFLIHYKVIKPEIKSHIINRELNLSIMTLNTDELLINQKWNKYANEYIVQNSPKINIKSCLVDYFTQKK